MGNKYLQVIKMAHLNIFFYLTLFYLFFSCQSVDMKKIKKKSWKESGGKYIRGVIVFHEKKEEGFYVDSTFNVYYYNLLVGKIIKVNNDEMIIRTIDNEKSYFLSF
jgi:hypothetical protein